MERYDRAGERMDYEAGGEGDYQETVNIMDLSLGRAPEPLTSNGEVRKEINLTTWMRD